MSKNALVILTDKIKVVKFEHKDDFDIARQSLVKRGVAFIPLRWLHGFKIWDKYEVTE